MKADRLKIIGICVITILLISVLFSGGNVSFNVGFGEENIATAYADTEDVATRLIAMPTNYVMGKWNFRMDSTDATPDTIVFFLEDSAVAPDTLGFTPGQIIFNRTLFPKFTGQIIVYNEDADDTLWFKFPGALEQWIQVLPNGSSVSLSPAFHDTMFTRSAGTDTVVYKYLFTEARIIK